MASLPFAYSPFSPSIFLLILLLFPLLFPQVNLLSLIHRLTHTRIYKSARKHNQVTTPAPLLLLGSMLFLYFNCIQLSLSYALIGVMSGDSRDLLNKIRCICLMDEFDNVVDTEDTSPLYQEPLLSCVYSCPEGSAGGDWNEAGDERNNEGDMDVVNPKSPVASSSSSSSSVSKRKRGDRSDAKVGLDSVLLSLLLYVLILYDLTYFFLLFSIFTIFLHP